MNPTAEEIRFVEMLRALKGEDNTDLLKDISNISEELAKELESYFNE